MNSTPVSDRYDVVVIGAGLSGLAAGIRLAHFDKKVCLVERHSRIGGLNSFFIRDGHSLDTGLHAITNYAEPDDKRAPLNRLLRQLRLRREVLELRPQQFSTIKFPDTELRFTNDFRVFEAEIADAFPAHVDEFRRLVKTVCECDAYSFHPPVLSTRQVCKSHITNPLLIDMILCPIMFYGNSAEDDMDFAQFCVLFRSVFMEGLFRPAGGMRPFLEQLRDRFLECGGDLVLGCGVRDIMVRDGRAEALVLDTGVRLRTDAVLSSAGVVETLGLCRPIPAQASEWPRGALSIVEVLVGLDQPASTFGFDASTLFWNDAPVFRYACPSESLDCLHGVACAPENFENGGVLPGTIPLMRLSILARPDAWLGLSEDAYRNVKASGLDKLLALLDRFVPGFRSHAIFTDMMTPRTIHRYTGRVNGALYGSPRKVRDGSTPVENLFVCGTDQGFLGIIGSLLSGVLMANYRILRRD